MFQLSSPSTDEALFLLRRRADDVMTLVCWLLFVAALCFAPLYGEWTACFLVGLPLAAAASLLRLHARGTLLCRLSLAAIFMVFSGLLIHESHGLVETHFSVFCLLAFLLYYRDWRPVVVAALVIAVHHYGVCQLQMAGLPVYVFPGGHACTMVWVHAAYVVLEAAVLSYLSVLIQREALETAAIAAFGRRLLETGTIDLNTDRSAGVQSPALEELLRALNKTVAEASRAAGGMNTVSGDVLSVAGEVLSAGLEQELSSKRALTAVRRMTQTTADVTHNCQEMAQAALSSAGLVRQGREHMQHTAATIEALVATVAQVSRHMGELQQESRRIEEIITLVADIAQKTDLLALNATIEAARAGDAGRAFHVVAQEIRSLAVRTHTSLAQVQGRVDSVREKSACMYQLTETCRLEATRGGAQVETAVLSLEAVTEQLPRLAGRAKDLIERAHEYGSFSQDAVAEMHQIEHNITVNSSSLQRIDGLVRSLKGMSSALMESVQTFERPEAHAKASPTAPAAAHLDPVLC